MTTPQPDILPDTPIAEVTVERIGEILDEQGLQYRIEDAPRAEGNGDEAPAEVPRQILRSGFVNTLIAMQLRGDTLVIDSIWRGQAPTSEGPQVLAALNQWNSEHFAPTLRFFESDQGNLAISAVRELHAASGLSRNQLGAFVMSSLNAIVEAYGFVESAYPQLVTWENDSND